MVGIGIGEEKFVIDGIYGSDSEGGVKFYRKDIGGGGGMKFISIY